MGLPLKVISVPGATGAHHPWSHPYFQYIFIFLQSTTPVDDHTHKKPMLARVSLCMSMSLVIL